MGEDNFMSLQKWHKRELFLLSISKLIVIPRLVDDRDFEKQKARLMEFNKEIVIEKREHHDFEKMASRIKTKV